MNELMKIRDVSEYSLKEWLLSEISTVASDFGQRLEDDQQKHIPKRLFEFLTEKYRNWDLGTIHSIFKAGVTGKYGKTSKVTVAAMLFWITSEEKLARGENVSSFPEDNTVYRERAYYNQIYEKCVPFINYCHDHWINTMDLSLEEYYNLRDRFNRLGESGVRSELERLPKYRSTSIFKEVRI